MKRATFLCNLPHNNVALQVELVCCAYYPLRATNVRNKIFVVVKLVSN